MPSPDFSFHGSAPGERRARHEHVLERALARRVDGPQLVVDRHARARHRLLVEVAGARSAARPPPARRPPAARARPRAPPSASRARRRRTRSRPWRARPSRRAWRSSRSPTRTRTAATRSPVALGADDDVVEDAACRPRAAAPRAASRTRACPGTDGGSVGTSNTRPPERALELGPDARAGRRSRARRGTRPLAAAQPAAAELADHARRGRRRRRTPRASRAR